MEDLEAEKKVEKIILIVPWFSLTNLTSKEEEKIASPWLETQINFTKVKPHAKQFTAIFSDNDYFVPYKENVALFKKLLNPQIITEHKKGHFSEDDGVIKLPMLLRIL